MVEPSKNESAPASAMFPLVYDELRQLAAAKFARGDPGQTLQPTALVHEAYLRIVSKDDVQFQNQGHFFAAAAEAMRRVMIDHARAKGATNAADGGIAQHLLPTNYSISLGRIRSSR